MKPHIIGALALSVSLIGGAAIMRFLPAQPGNLDLVSVPNATTTGSATLIDVFTAASPTVETRLSDTDLISRQLFTEYAQLSVSGKLNSASLQGLGVKYAESILKQGSFPASPISKNDLSLAPDTQASFSTYSAQISAFKKKYTTLVEKISPQSLSDGEGTNFRRFAAQASELYTMAARELTTIPVPTSLAVTHAALTSAYLTDASAMQIIGDSNTDPLKIYTAISAQIQNSQKEASLFSTIKAVLQANGIINTDI